MPLCSCLGKNPDCSICGGLSWRTIKNGPKKLQFLEKTKAIYLANTGRKGALKALKKSLSVLHKESIQFGSSCEQKP